MARDLKQVSATGNVTTTVPAYLHSVVLTPTDGTNGATLDVKDGSGGSTRLSLVAPAAGPSAVWTAGGREGVLFGTAIHATITSDGTAVASFEFS